MQVKFKCMSKTENAMDINSTTATISVRFSPLTAATENAGLFANNTNGVGMGGGNFEFYGLTPEAAANFDAGKDYTFDIVEVV